MLSFENVPVIPGVLGYKISCDDGWTGFSESKSCYRVMNRIDESFNDAEQICKNYDGNLVIIDSVSEKVKNRLFLSNFESPLLVPMVTL